MAPPPTMASPAMMTFIALSLLAATSALTTTNIVVATAAAEVTSAAMGLEATKTIFSCGASPHSLLRGSGGGSSRGSSSRILAAGEEKCRLRRIHRRLDDVDGEDCYHDDAKLYRR